MGGKSEPEFLEIEIMEVSLVNFRRLDTGIRLDSEYYRPEFLAVEAMLKSKQCKKLEDIIKTIKSFGAYALCNQVVLVEKGIPFIRCKDIKEGFVDFSDVLYIDEATNKLLQKSAVKPETVMLTMSGTVGNAAIASNNWQYPINSNQDIAKIETNDLCKPYYLTTFFNSKYGKAQTKRLPVGSIQQHIFIWQLKELLVFVASNEFQEIIEHIYIKAIQSLSESDALYNEAQKILLSELGLIDWKPKRQLSFVRSFSDTKSSDRIDAEYFQPMYDELIEKVKQYRNGCKTLGKCVKIKDKNFVPKDDITYKYIELANISANGNINGFTEAEGKELPSRARRKVNTGDVIVSSIEGSLSSISLINGDLDNALCSTGFYVINSDTLNCETLLVLLKSPVGQLQLKKGCSGTILTAINNEEFKRILLPDISASIQEEIKRNISELYKEKAISKKLFDIAKRGVELAIEKSEKEAEKWLNAEVGKCQVTM